MIVWTRVETIGRCLPPESGKFCTLFYNDSPYRLRKQLPEPVFGQIKQARSFRQFLLRGVEKVAAEWGLVCIAHNILKLAKGRTPSLADAATA